jgi:lipoprotein-anchoring transpeptidase ErfK/SrfK
MLPRFLTAFAVAAGLIFTAADTGLANPAHDPEGRFTGGMPQNGLFRLFGPSIRRTQVSYPSKYAPGTVVVNTTERRLYYILDGAQAVRYGIGVGRDGFTWAGDLRVTDKREWPDWTPPPQMLKRRPDLPRFMKGGEDNPLGARAMYLGSSLFRIHGTSEPETIGQAVSSGCFRLLNEDVIDLYNRVKIGARVIVMR